MRRACSFKSVLSVILLVLCLASCKKEKDNLFISEGTFTHQFIKSLHGFEEDREAILANNQVDKAAFIRLSTDSAWALSTAEQKALLGIRNAISRPDENTLLQKAIPLEELSTYMNNIYGGTVGGFVATAADVKSLSTMYDVYYGLRLDYAGTKFRPDGAGYAVIRFYSTATDKLTIPYSPELGGTQPHEWPNGGGGFTTSTLGYGGYPEWVTNGYYAPKEGAELYEVTPQGREILRSVYTDGKWQTHESEYYPLPDKTTRTVVAPGKAYLGAFAQYAGHTFMVRGETSGMIHLASYKDYPLPGLYVIEKGVYGLDVPKTEVAIL